MLAFFTSSIFFGQRDPGTTNFTPEGVLDNVFDQDGNLYQLNDLLIENYTSNNPSARTSLLTCSSTSYFNLYFEDGSGMENIFSNPTQNAINLQRRNVVCKVFENISNFIQSPLTSGGNTTKVNIWIRNINNVVYALGQSPNFPTITATVPGIGTSFYCVPYLNNTAAGGIADGEIWKTIHLGKDSYTNIAAPIFGSNPNGGLSGRFFHGMIALNFNAPNNIPEFKWNLDLNNPAANDEYDLYTIVLKQVTSALGISSLINNGGTSKFGTNFKYYNRFDLFLKNNSKSEFLIKSNSTCLGASTMYDYIFNQALSSIIITPNTQPYSSDCFDYTYCNKQNYFKSATVDVPVFTTNCFNKYNTLSRFIDTYYPNCTTPYGGGNYFVNSFDNLTGLAGTKRFLKPEERNVLCDLGYKVNTTFGDSSNTSLNAPTNFYGSSVCNGINVAGLNDGINNNGTYLFIANLNNSPNLNLIGSQILNNDYNASNFQCLEDMTEANTLNVSAGTNTTNIYFSATIPGIHLLRYVPMSLTGQIGNITYVYVFVRAGNSTINSTYCDNEFVINGNLETSSALVDSKNQLYKALNWESFGGTSPDYFQSNIPTNNLFVVPCNYMGVEGDVISTNGKYAGIVIDKNINFTEIIKTQLKTALLPNKQYSITFNVSLAENYSNSAFKLKLILSPNDLNGAFTSLPAGLIGGISFTTQNYIQNYNGWDTVTFTFNSGNNNDYRYIYIGADLDVPNITTQSAPNNMSCSRTFNCFATANNRPNKSYYYIDNLSLKEVISGTFTLPATIACSPQMLPDLSIYLAGLPAPSTINNFSLMGSPANSGANSNTVKQWLGKWRFNTTGLIPGLYTLSYNYINDFGCANTRTSTIVIAPCDVLIANQSGEGPWSLGCRFLGSTQSAFIFERCTVNGQVAIGAPVFATQTNTLIPGVTLYPDGFLAIGSNVLPGYYTLEYKICQNTQPLNCSNTASFNFNISPRIQANDDDIYIDPFGNMQYNQNLDSFKILQNDFLQCNVAKSTDVVLTTVSTNPNFTLNTTTGVITLTTSNLPIYSSYSMTYKVALLGNPAISSIATINVIISSTIGQGANGAVYTTNLITNSTNNILITGNFTTFSGFNRKNIALLNYASLNQLFLPYYSANSGTTHPTISNELISTVCVDGNNAFFGGQFTGYTGITANRIVKINAASGAKDPTFAGALSGTVFKIEKIPNSNQILVVGSFTNTYGSGTKQGIARLDSNTGALDITFNTNGAGANGVIDCVAIDNMGRIIITGNFTKYNNIITATGIARLLADGSLDSTFNAGLGFNRVYLAGATQANIKKIMFNGTDIFICGSFSTYNGSQAQNIVKIQSTGAINSAFTGRASSKVNDMAFTDTNKSSLYIGGQFLNYANNPTQMQRLVKIDSTSGSQETAFNDNVVSVNPFNDTVFSLTVQSDGRLIIGGAFTEYKGQQAKGITRIDAIGNQGRKANPGNNESEVYNKTVIYPNPSNGFFTIDLTENQRGYDNLTVSNVLGQQLLTAKIENNALNTVDLTNYCKGIYIVRLQNDNETQEFKLLKN